MKGMTVIVKTISSWVKVLILLFGIYIILFGDIGPGGGFAGGVILAASYVLLLLAFGSEFVERNMPVSLVLRLLCVGMFCFIALAISGLFVGTGEFFRNWIYQDVVTKKGIDIHIIGAGIIPLAEIAIGLLVAAAVYLVIFTFSTFRSEQRQDLPVESLE